jgi:hypothetical protein
VFADLQRHLKRSRGGQKQISPEARRHFEACAVMTKDEASSERVRQYLRQITPQARRNLLAEIERMQMYGEAMPGSEVLLVELRAEFRGSGETHDRLGNPSRHFFQPIEALFVNRPSERTGPWQISRGSLSAIWEWISNDLLRTMARDYSETVRDALVRSDAQKARVIASDFQTKVLKSLQGTLDSDDGVARARNGLAKYTSSHAAIGDLRKVMFAFQVRDPLDKLARALPPKIDELQGKPLANVRGFLDAFAAQHAEAVPFALTVVMKRLKMRWHLIRLATSTAQGRGAAAVAGSRFALSIPMVLDHLDDARVALKQAMRSDRLQVAKDNLAEIYEIEAALRDEITQLETSEWGQKLDSLMAQVAADLESEFHRLPEGTRHVLGGLNRGPRGGLASLMRKSRDALLDIVRH